ncbi:hypothetical protein BGX30_006751 [Mortierella sp. GBA39]|nr:hypothetical protein BGX30_006751 [Mortierella sp. GBA39]
MFRTGILGYGGGPSTVPLIRHEAVSRYRWMADEEFGEVLAIANTLPGPIATKLAAYLGYRLKGTLGALFGEKAVKGLGKYMALACGVIAFVLLEWVQLHPAILIAIALAYGSVHFKVMGKLKETRKRKEERRHGDMD